MRINLFIYSLWDQYCWISFCVLYTLISNTEINITSCSNWVLSEDRNLSDLLVILGQLQYVQTKTMFRVWGRCVCKIIINNLFIKSNMFTVSTVCHIITQLDTLSSAS